MAYSVILVMDNEKGMDTLSKYTNGKHEHMYVDIFVRRHDEMHYINACVCQIHFSDALGVYVCVCVCHMRNLMLTNEMKNRLLTQDMSTCRSYYKIVTRRFKLK